MDRDDGGRLALTAGIPSAATLEQYVAGLSASGIPACAGSDRTYWVSSAERVVRRLPTFHVGTPSQAEVDHALKVTGGLLATYITEPDESHPVNAWLYVCGDQHYAAQRRSPAMQRNVRRALRELTIDWVSPAELYAHGASAFCDTRRRSALDDGTLKAFRRYFDHRIDRPGRSYLGAWKDGRLAAFVTVIRVDDWAEVGSSSMDAMLRYRPNDALMYVVLSRYLADPTCRVVTYGLSSIQARTNNSGLHRFKTKVGFEPIAVHRAFTLHPSLRPFAHQTTLTAAYWMVNGFLSIRPRNRRLKKLGGMLACMLRGPAIMPIASGQTHSGVPTPSTLRS